MSETLKIVTAEDAALLKKPVARVAEFGPQSEDDPGKLIDLLEDIDGLKHEIHERMLRIEAVKQAREILQEDAVRTDVLNRKLAELGKAMVGVQAETRREEIQAETAGLPRVQARGFAPEVMLSGPELRSLGDGTARSWRQPDEPGNERDDRGDSPQWNDQPNSALVLEVPELTIQPVDGHRAWTEADNEARDSFLAASEVLEQAEKSWRQADQATLEARQILDQSALELAAARRMEEAATANLQSARQESRDAYFALCKRMEEIELSWKQADQVIVEAKQLLDQTRAERTQTSRQDLTLNADVESLREELLAAYQSATERSAEATRLLEQAGDAVAESKRQRDSAMAEVAQARQHEETATAEFTSARQELTTAYQFAAVAARRQQFAEEFFTKAARWAVLSGAVAWIAVVWFGWFAFRAFVPIWGAGIATVAVVLIARFVGKKGVIEG
jgi:hypothetical protein